MGFRWSLRKRAPAIWVTMSFMINKVLATGKYDSWRDKHVLKSTNMLRKKRCDLQSKITIIRTILWVSRERRHCIDSQMWPFDSVCDFASNGGLYSVIVVCYFTISSFFEKPENIVIIVLIFLTKGESCRNSNYHHRVRREILHRNSGATFHLRLPGCRRRSMPSFGSDSGTG